MLARAAYRLSWELSELIESNRGRRYWISVRDIDTVREKQLAGDRGILKLAVPASKNGQLKS